jgi:hypothetical protein
MTSFEQIKSKLINTFIGGFTSEERDHIDISDFTNSKSVNDLIRSLDGFGFTNMEAFQLIFNCCEELIEEKSSNL